MSEPRRVMTADHLDTLAAIAQEVVGELMAATPEHLVVMIGEEVATRVSQRCGGSAPYIAKGKVYQAKRTEQLVIEALARNRRDPTIARAKLYSSTAAQLGISVVHVYRVEKRAVESERARRQGVLTLE